MKPDRERLVSLGRVGKPHGLQGELRVFPSSLEPDQWAAALESTLYLEHDHPKRLTPVRLDSFRMNGRAILATFQGVVGRVAAERLAQADLLIDRDNLPDLSGDECYHCDLEGLTVIDEPTGATLGHVETVKDDAAQDRLVVRKPDRRLFQIPFIKAFVGEVDLSEGVIRVNLPPGLIDLND